MNTPRITINLPKLYLQINHMRQLEKLPIVDAETIAVHTNLRFTVVQRRHLNLKGDTVVVTRDDADLLCAIIDELYKVRPYLYGAPELAQVPHSDKCELSLAHLYEAIHERRRAENRMPMETAVIAVRLGVKFLILRRRVLDFKEPTLLLDDADITAIEQILAEQFAVTLPNGLKMLCNQPQFTQNNDVTNAQSESAEVDPAKPPQTWITRMLQRFTGYGSGVRQRHYHINASALLMAITQQRAAKGYKYISPADIQFRYTERLILELRIRSAPDPSVITLTKAQFATLGTIIQEEFGIVIENINDFIGKAGP